ncbi:MAG: flagellar type III secretion system protein FlhB [Rhodobacteraceae bacterium]|nr:flagellar type III secretion system protein FlhB [Paracoccaceae bacterium]
MSDSTDDKPHDPTQKRLDDARDRGEVPRSPDLSVAAAYGGLLLVFTGFGARLIGRIAETCATILGEADRIEPGAVIGLLVRALLPAVAPLVLAPAALVLVVLLAQRGIVFTPTKLMPKASRISPLAAAAHKFGRGGLVDFAKSVAKLAAVSTALYAVLAREMPRITGLIALSPAIATQVQLQIALRFLAVVVAVSAVIGVLDYLWQRAEHLRKLRMSRQEMIDEMKDSEGDPQVKHQRRRRGAAIALNQMIADVARADVVIVNPTHYAVALKWSRAARRAPICVAKGTDEVAARIRAAAAGAGVPLHSDPQTARALHAEVEIGAEVRPGHYQAVAAAIRFSEKMRAKARRGLR